MAITQEQMNQLKATLPKKSGNLDAARSILPKKQPQNFIQQTEQDINKAAGSIKSALGGGIIGSTVGGVYKGLSNLGIGAGKEVIETTQGLGQVFLKGANKALGTNFDTSATFFQQPNALEKKGIMQNVGGGAVEVMKYMAPTSAVNKGQAAVTGITNLLPGTGKVATGIKSVLGITGRAGVEAAGTGAVGYLSSGGDIEQAKKEATIAGGFSAGLGTVGAVYRGLKGSAQGIVDTGIIKGIRPSVAGKNNANQTAKYINDARDAVSLIAQNKNLLRFDDGSGNMVARLPQNLDEFSRSISDVKKNIFSQYDNLAKGTETAGLGKVVNLKTVQSAKVPLSNISDELQKVVSNKVVADNAPDVARYAADRAKTFAQRGSYSATEAQEAIKIYNDHLQAFYRNPSPELANKISIDALIVNNLRKNLDDTITNLQGSGYQELKRQYGKLSAIEKDVAHRAVVEARKNVKGLPDYADMISTGDIVSGIVSGNPAQIARGVGINFVKNKIKSTNSADEHIRRMFEAIEAPQKPTNPALGRIFGAYSKKDQEIGVKKMSELMKNPPIGLKIQDISVTPEQVAKKIDAIDVEIIKQFLGKPKDVNTFLKAQPILEGMKISEADPKIQEKFLREVLDISTLPKNKAKLK